MNIKPSLASIFNLWKSFTLFESINVIGCEELTSVESTSIKLVLVDNPAVSANPAFIEKVERPAVRANPAVVANVEIPAKSENVANPAL